MSEKRNIIKLKENLTFQASLILTVLKTEKFVYKLNFSFFIIIMTNTNCMIKCQSFSHFIKSISVENEFHFSAVNEMKI